MEQFISRIDSLVEEIGTKMRDENIPGLVLSVVSKDSVVWTQSFGYTSQKLEEQTTVDTIVGLQSTTKNITAVAFLKAVELGLVGLDDPVRKYYTSFSVKHRFDDDPVDKITFRLLLSHQSGLPNTSPRGGVFGSDPKTTFEERVESLSETWLEYYPGTDLRYSNVGMDLVAYTLQLITNKPYLEYVQEEVMIPLGIESFTLHSSEASKRENVFQGNLGSFEAEYQENDNGYGCGTGFMSHKDLASYLQFLLREGRTASGEQLIRPELMKEMLVDNGSYGLGVFINSTLGYTHYSHAGGGFGFSSKMDWIPALNIGVVAQCNQEYQGLLSSLPEKIFKLFTDVMSIEQGEEWPEPQGETINLPENFLKTLDGAYIGLSGQVAIIYEEGNLLLRLSGERHHLACKGGNISDKVIFTSEPARYIAFHIKESARIQLHLYLNSWSELLILNKAEVVEEELASDDGSWSTYVGLYLFHYYRTEIIFFVVYELGSRLTINGQPLYRYDTGVYYTATGEMVEFIGSAGGGGALYKSIHGEKVEDPVNYLRSLAEDERTRRQVSEYLIKNVVDGLRNLGRSDEADKLEQLRPLNSS